MLVADDPPVGNALLREARQNCSSAQVLSDFREYRNIQPEARHGDGGIDRAAAGVCRHIFRFRLAAFLEEQEGTVGMMQRQALDTLALDTAIVSIMAPPTVRTFILTPISGSRRRVTHPPSRPTASVGVSYPLPFGAG